jgi:glycerol-3-phosphate dehydrogenase (NAD(P)+)
MDAKIGLIGYGSMATALAKVLTDNLDKINWIITNSDIIESLQTRNNNYKYLPYVDLDLDKLNLISSIESGIEQSDILFISIPAAYLDGVISKVDKSLFSNKKIVVAIKGLIPEKNLPLHKYFEQIIGIPLTDYLSILGPSHAEEIVMEHYTDLILVSKNPKMYETIYPLLNSYFLHLEYDENIELAEYAAVVKNIYAILAGMCIGYGLGDNFLSVLVTKIANEMKDFLKYFKNDVDIDIMQPLYLGDLLVTIYSQFSRNRSFGILLGKGYSLEYSKIEMKQTVEGYYGIFTLANILGDDISKFPLISIVYRVLSKQNQAIREIKNLLKIM